MTGVKTYQEVRKTLPPQPKGRVVAEFGAAQLIDYRKGETNAPKGVILLVPSLINRATILDLAPERSFVKFLVENGYRPLVMDWGSATRTEQDFDLTNYITDYLAAALRIAVAENQAKAVPLVGYCMGGLLSLAAAQLYPQMVSRLILLATPWNFHHQSQFTEVLIKNLPYLATLIEKQQGLTIDCLQSLFYGLDPFLVINKYCDLGAAIASNPKLNSQFLNDFARLEDWLNDGVPLVKGVARETILGWYGQNSPFKLQWRIAGQVIDPSLSTHPAWVVIPSRDRIVPPESALILGQGLAQAQIVTPDIGHVGMMVSPRAKSLVWQPMVQWLEQ